MIKSIFEMKAGDYLPIVQGVSVLRVEKGWFFLFFDRNSVEMQKTFVADNNPYNDILNCIKVPVVKNTIKGVEKCAAG